MSTQHQGVAGTAPGQPPATSGGNLLAFAGPHRLYALAAVFALVWVSPTPFSDRTASRYFLADGDANLTSSVINISVCLLALLVGLAVRGDLLRKAYNHLLAITIGWCAFCSVISLEPSLSIRRFVLLLLVVMMAQAALILPASARQFAQVLTALALAITAVCFASLLIAPGLGVHQPNDLEEPLLAGDWRGIFIHKNTAGAIMAQFTFLGILAARIYSRQLGILLTGLALIFLWGSGSKTALLLLPLSLLIAHALMGQRSLASRALLVLPPILALNLFTVGSVVWSWVKQLDAKFLPDPSFTGRDQIWLFAIEKLWQRPLTGYGFLAFWRTPSILYGGAGDLPSRQEGVDATVTLSSQSHNGYLDTAVTIGFPGLALTVALLVLKPILDSGYAELSDSNKALKLFFIQNWIFAISCAGLEAYFFDRTDSLWFMLLFSTFGLGALASRNPRAS